MSNRQVQAQQPPQPADHENIALVQLHGGNAPQGALEPNALPNNPPLDQDNGNNHSDDDDKSVVSFDFDSDDEENPRPDDRQDTGDVEKYQTEINPSIRRWREMITKSYLDVREEDKNFWRDMQQDKEPHTTASQVNSQPVNNAHGNNTQSVLGFDEDCIPEVQERYFLGLEHMRIEDPFFGFSYTEDLAANMPLDEFSAHFPPKSRASPPTSSSNPIGASDQEKAASTVNFQLVANFPSVATGQHMLYLKTRQDGEQLAAARFSARILVRYVSTRTTEVYFTRFCKSPKDDSTEWHYLKAEGQFEVRPRTGIAQVNIKITPDHTYINQSGRLLIQSLQLVPAEMAASKPQDNIFARVGQSSYSFLATQPPVAPENMAEGHRAANAAQPNIQPGGEPPRDESRRSEEKGVVTRLAVSKDGCHLAALTVFSNRYTVQAWNKNEVEKLKETLQYGAIAAPIHIDNAQNLSLELAISASGDYIAVYEAPKVGEWREGEQVPTARIGVKIFSNNHENEFLTMQGDCWLRQLDPVAIPANLQKSVGFATFVDKFKACAASLPLRFVFCNGLYLDVYEMVDNRLRLSNTIPLTKMGSSLLRADACELMVRSISTNMFVWFEENGRYCSTWDLSNGSAIGRIEVTGLKYGGASGATTMRVACNQNIIAIVGYDNSVTTIDATSGVLISRRLIPDQSIEHIAFPTPESQMLLVMVRGEDENQQTVLILDPLQLDVQGMTQHYVPPLSRSSVFGLFGPKAWPEIGSVCRADGDRIHVYNCKEPDPPTNKTQQTGQFQQKRLPQEGVRSQSNAEPNKCQYELRFSYPKFRRGSGGGHQSHKRQVEVWKRADPEIPSSSESCVFSFIPEPWVQNKDVGGKILSTNDRFVVYANWTVQLWSLPTDDEPRCRLLFFWSYTGGINHSNKDDSVFGKTELEIVLDCYALFSSVYVHENQDLRWATVVFPSDIPVKQVFMPHTPIQYSDSLVIIEHCIKSIWLLALTYDIVSPPDQDMQAVEQHASCNRDHGSAIIEFVNTYLNHSIGSIEQDKKTILSCLLANKYSSNLGANFISALLSHQDCNWIPRNEAIDHSPEKTSGNNAAGNPLQIAIRNTNTLAVRSILDYCARKAALTHPTYIMPIEYSFEELSDIYSVLLQDVFRKAAYIPAQRLDFNRDYVDTSTLDWGVYAIWFLVKFPVLPRFLNWLRWLTRAKQLEKPELKDYKDPIITFQLKDCTTATGQRLVTFQKIAPPKSIELHYDWKVYAVPFPSLIALHSKSPFFQLSRKEYFESPPMMAILNYKFWQYGLFYWILRYFFLIVFYGIFMAITFIQMRKSEDVATTNDLPGLVLARKWWWAIVFDLFLGTFFLTFELVQLWHDGVYRYLSTLFNYIDVFSTISTMVCLGHTLRTQWNGNPLEQFSYTGYAIIATYIHLLLEFRVFQQVGTIVNIIVEIMKRIRAFIVVFTLTVIGFTHGLVYTLYVYQISCNESGECSRNTKSGYPHGIISSFATTIFFLAGRYDVVDDDFAKERLSFLLMMIFFYFLCSIVLLTVLIAKVNDAFNDAQKDGVRAWRKQLYETLSEAEMMAKPFRWLGAKVPPIAYAYASLRQRFQFLRSRSQPFPNIIYYVSRDQDVMNFKEELKNKKQ